MKRKILIGRDPHCDIHIDERFDTVSNRHAEIELADDRLIYTDTSTNGTIINNQRVKGYQVTIYPGDKIYLAGVYHLAWGQLQTYFPEVSRPTVTRNSHAENRPQSPYGGKPTVIKDRAGRPTEAYNPSAGGRPTDYRERSSFRPSVPPPPAVGYGEPSSRAIDTELKRWNWGAFLLGWLWAAFHRIYWPMFLFAAGFMNAIISFVFPLISTAGSLLISLAALGINIYLGLNGSHMAWDLGCYNSLQHFKDKERKWRNAAFIVVGASILLSFLFLLILAIAVG